MCPGCGSTHLKIKQAKGFERIVILWTKKRKYLCKDCYHSFRATDRRVALRPSSADAAPDGVSAVE